MSYLIRLTECRTLNILVIWLTFKIKNCFTIILWEKNSTQWRCWYFMIIIPSCLIIKNFYIKKMTSSCNGKNWAWFFPFHWDNGYDRPISLLLYFHRFKLFDSYSMSHTLWIKLYRYKMYGIKWPKFNTLVSLQNFYISVPLFRLYRLFLKRI